MYHMLRTNLKVKKFKLILASYKHI